ncbi:MAG: hypothetical protein MUE44_21425 [Oscillatoriaceae cyanobacterium Prado104]|jgi:hypothetical protein|nr:hypothetical protein [Oscillatoriaceae cyanobacterium Prado104]
MVALTPEQTAAIPIYRDKWWQIGLSVKPIDRAPAAAAINTAYNIIGFPEPEIVFCDSPLQALQTIQPLTARGELWLETANAIRNKIHNEVYDSLRAQLPRELENQIYSLLYNPLYDRLINQLKLHVEDELYTQLKPQLGERYLVFWMKINCNHNFIVSELSACHGSWVDFCISVLKLEVDRSLHSAFVALTENCGWIYPYVEKCFVCDRPRKINFDSAGLLHATGQPAVEFADKFSVYCYRGVRLPETYGQVAPESWQAQWLLTTKNAEVRRVLIGAIGYEKICQELQAIELDSWQEYTLLKIDNDVDIEPIHLLKMTCPSTGKIHALRVPPGVRSAASAISWVNWGTNPEEFQVQT